jgi:hypothetical protein
MAKIRTHLPIAPLPIFLPDILADILHLSPAGAPLASPSRADHRYVQGMLTIPPITSSFGAAK